MAEQASSNREDKRHGAYIPKDLMPFFEADPPLVGGGWRKRIFEVVILVGGQTQCHVDCVNQTTKEHLAGRPLRVTFIKFLEREDLLSLFGLQLVQRSEHLVHSMDNPKKTSHMPRVGRFCGGRGVHGTKGKG